MTDPKIPALPEPVAYQYRWKIDGEWVNWRFSDASQKHPALDSLEERPLFSATQLQEALDRADMAEKQRDGWQTIASETTDRLAKALYHYKQSERRATTAEAALAGTCGSKATCDQVISEWRGRLEAAEVAIAAAEAERDAAHNEALDRAAARLRLVFAISGEPYALQVLYLKKETT